jgi:hypothetical protein
MVLTAEFSVILILMRDSYAVKLESRKTEIWGRLGKFATSTREVPMALNRTENSRDTLIDELYSDTKIENTEK